MFIQKIGNSRESHQLILELGYAVSFILEAQVVYRMMALAQAGYNLLRFTYRHSRVACAVQDNQRRGNAIYLVDGRDRSQKFAVGFQRTVLHFPQLATVAT